MQITGPIFDRSECMPKLSRNRRWLLNNENRPRNHLATAWTGNFIDKGTVGRLRYCYPSENRLERVQTTGTRVTISKDYFVTVRRNDFNGRYRD